MTKDTPFDLIIIGASAAGVAAAIYAARRNLRFLIISEDVGGEVANSGDIDNYPGIVHTDGIALTEEFKKQLDRYKVQTITQARVEQVTKEGEIFHLQVKEKDGPATYQSRTVIVATGVHPRHLDIPGETEFYGKGVTYCTTCDGPLFKGKTVATIGGGNSALESAIMLAGIAEKVYVLNIHSAMKGEQVLIDNMLKLPNVEFIPHARSSAILGETAVTGLEYLDTDTDTTKKLDVQGVFVHIGFIPNADPVKEIVTITPYGEIEVNGRMETNVPGLFAAGDVTNTPWKQIAIATGQGVTAVLNAVEYINKLKT